MFDLVFFDVTVGNGMNADRRLATFARAIWFGTMCGEVPRLVTIVTDVRSIGLRDGGPRGRRGANRCERSFRRRPLVLCRVSDFEGIPCCSTKCGINNVGSITSVLGPTVAKQ